MQNLYDTFTKDKTKVSYEFWVEKSLINLGFCYSNAGTHYLKKMILYVFENDLDNVTMEKLYIEISKKTNKKPLAIKGAIKYAINMINTTKAKSNFYKIFNYEYDYYFLTPKNLILLFVTLLNRI